MFSKIWKTLKIFLIIAIILICLPHSILPVQKSDSPSNDFEGYRKQNESETRLAGYKDNDEALRIKVDQLELINKSRKKFKAGEVKLDILASRVANKMCKEAAENNFMGHWNMTGEKPYHRYGFAGGYDHISENAFGEWSTGMYDTSYANISSLMKSGHDIFMAEKAPNDGHKKTVIEKTHNFVGIGFCLSGKQFRYYEEFIDRYLEFENIPAEVAKGEPVSITVKTNGESFLYYLMVYREKFPQPMTPDQINARGSYDDFTKEEYLVLPAWDLSRYRNGKIYTIPFKFTREGLYYIHIYTDKKEIRKPMSLNTSGKTPVSGIVIKVNN
jgi:uncharacterized protein YkwD